MSEIAVGQSIQLTDGRYAVVRFVGQTHFAAGDWVGVELEDDTGKNDGSVQGERYFDCDHGRGMFVRPTTVTILAQQPVSQPKPAAVPARKTSRASNVIPNSGRPSSINDPSMGKRMSLNASSPSPVPRQSRPSSMVRSPTKSPTKQLGSTATSATSSRTGTPSATANPRASGIGVGAGAKPRPSVAGTRTSMGPPALPSSRLTRNPSTSSSAAKPATGVSRAPAAGRVSSVSSRGGLSRTASGRVRSGDSLSGNESGPGNRVTSPLKSDGEQSSPVRSRTKALEKITSKGAMGAAAPKTSAPAASTSTAARGAATNAASRENEELKTKLKVLERKRLEDREQMKDLTKLQERGEKLENINKKIEAKFQSANQENAELRKQLKEAADRLEQIESLQAEHDSIMELATLDREMAEETAEVYKAELEALKSKSEELELEVEILREENSEYSQGVTAEDRASTSWLQMERTNERLRDALIRIRDIMEQQDEEAKAQIKDLTQDLEEFEAVKEQYEIAKEKLLETELRAEDLRQQLDDNLGAEDLIEQLSIEKLQQSEEVAELKAVIEDLEALKEISDELEANHVQNEKEMQEELNYRDSAIAESNRRAADQDATIEDMEYTLSRFRELVTNLQTDLEDMRASHAVNEAESEQLESKSRAMMDLNQKLQISAVKTQIKTIDLELQRMDAQEAQQHLNIVKMFLPDNYSTDRDSVLALLRFSRLAFKANLLHGFVKERVNGQIHPGHEDDIFAGCDALDKLTWVSSMCDRFVNSISHCSLEEFAKFQGALYELEPVERALNGWIDGLRRDELKEKQCASELQRTIALMTHLGEVHISEGLESFADEVQMQAVLMQSHLESAALTLGVARDMVQRVVPAPPEGEEDEMGMHFTRRSEAVITQTRSAKVVVGKAVRSLEDLKARSLSLTPETADVFEQCETASRELAEMSRKIGADLHALLSEEGRAEPFTYTDVQSAIHRTVMAEFSSSDSDLFSTYLSKLRNLSGQVSDLAAVCGDLSQTQEFERNQAPWILRAQELKAIKTIPVDTEEKIRNLTDQLNEAKRATAMREENLSTASLRIDTLEKRMKDANSKAERIAGLEEEIEKAQAHAAELAKSLDAQDRELKTLETERDQWKKIAGDTKAFGDAAGGGEAGAKAGQERAVATAREMDALKNDIASLQAAVRYLREDSRRARMTEQSRYDWLSEPLKKPTPVTEQRGALVRAEGKDVLGELVRMASEATVYDLSSSTAEDRMSWRPARSTPQYHAAKQAEDLASWRSWQRSVVEKANLVHGGGVVDDAKKTSSMMMRKRAAARLKIRLPSMDGGGKTAASMGEVQIAGSRDWERIQSGARLAAVM